MTEGWEHHPKRVWTYTSRQANQDTHPRPLTQRDYGLPRQPDGDTVRALQGPTTSSAFPDAPDLDRRGIHVGDFLRGLPEGVGGVNATFHRDQHAPTTHLCESTAAYSNIQAVGDNS